MKQIEIHPGNSAEYLDEFEIECNNIKPCVSGPDHIDIGHSVDELENVEVDQAFIGSSTNGRIEDLEIGSAYTKGKESS